MGAGESTANGGFRIFKVNPNSPAARAGLEVFFDYIVEIDGLEVIRSSAERHRGFFEKVQQSLNREIGLVVYNVRTKLYRDVKVTPMKWGGSGLLGATVRYDQFDSAAGQGLRVLEVFPNSPSAMARLIPFYDYILGTQDVAFKELDELVEVVGSHLDRPLSLHVYNSESESTRIVHIVPSYRWGGQGCLGCDIGTGFIHRIPRTKASPPVSPPKMLPDFSSVTNTMGSPHPQYPPGSYPLYPPPAPIDGGATSGGVHPYYPPYNSRGPYAPPSYPSHYPPFGGAVPPGYPNYPPPPYPPSQFDGSGNYPPCPPDGSGNYPPHHSVPPFSPGFELDVTREAQSPMEPKAAPTAHLHTPPPPQSRLVAGEGVPGSGMSGLTSSPAPDGGNPVCDGHGLGMDEHGTSTTVPVIDQRTDIHHPAGSNEGGYKKPQDLSTRVAKPPVYSMSSATYENQMPPPHTNGQVATMIAGPPRPGVFYGAPYMS